MAHTSAERHNKMSQHDINNDINRMSQHDINIDVTQLSITQASDATFGGVVVGNATTSDASL
jgi:hypothetical protein